MLPAFSPKPIDPPIKPVPMIVTRSTSSSCPQWNGTRGLLVVLSNQRANFVGTASLRRVHSAQGRMIERSEQGASRLRAGPGQASDERWADGAQNHKQCPLPDGLGALASVVKERCDDERGIGVAGVNQEFRGSDAMCLVAARHLAKQRLTARAEVRANRATSYRMTLFNKRPAKLRSSVDPTRHDHSRYPP